MKHLLCALICTLVALGANAEIRIFKADVTKTMIHEGQFGNCMAKLKPSPDQVGLDCKKDWVTFSCCDARTRLPASRIVRKVWRTVIFICDVLYRADRRCGNSSGQN